MSWLPGWHLDRATALMTMVFADTAGIRDICELHGNCDHRWDWAGLLGRIVPDALARIAGPPYRAGQDKSALPADAEAAE